MKRILIDKSISDRVLTVGERYWDPVHGGIVSVLKAYRESFETFPFIASSGRLNWAHKLWYAWAGASCGTGESRSCTSIRPPDGPSTSTPTTLGWRG